MDYKFWRKESGYELDFTAGKANEKEEEVNRVMIEVPEAVVTCGWVTEWVTAQCEAAGCGKVVMLEERPTKESTPTAKRRKLTPHSTCSEINVTIDPVLLSENDIQDHLPGLTGTISGSNATYGFPYHPPTTKSMISASSISIVKGANGFVAVPSCVVSIQSDGAYSGLRRTVGFQPTSKKVPVGVLRAALRTAVGKINTLPNPFETSDPAQLRAALTAVLLRYPDTLVAPHGSSLVVCGLASTMLTPSSLCTTKLFPNTPRWILDDISAETGATLAQESHLSSTLQWAVYQEEETPRKSWTLTEYSPVFKKFSLFNECSTKGEGVDLLKVKDLVMFRAHNGGKEVGEVTTLCGAACVVSFKSTTWFGNISLLRKLPSLSQASSSMWLGFTGTRSQCEQAAALLKQRLTQQRRLLFVPPKHAWCLATLLPQIKQHCNLSLQLSSAGLLASGISPYVNRLKLFIDGLCLRLECNAEERAWDEYLRKSINTNTSTRVSTEIPLSSAPVWNPERPMRMHDRWGTSDAGLNTVEIRGTELGLWSAMDVFNCTLLSKVNEVSEIEYELPTGSSLLGASGRLIAYPEPAVGDKVMSSALTYGKVTSLTPPVGFVKSVESNMSCVIENKHGAHTVHPASVHILCDAKGNTVDQRGKNAGYIHSMECILSNSDSVFLTVVKEWFASALYGWPSPGKPKFVKLVVSNDAKDPKGKQVEILTPRTALWRFVSSTDPVLVALSRVTAMKWEALVDDALLKTLVTLAKTVVRSTKEYDPVARLSAYFADTKNTINEASKGVEEVLAVINSEEIKDILSSSMLKVAEEWRGAVGIAAHELAVVSKELRGELVAEKIAADKDAGLKMKLAMIQEQTATLARNTDASSIQLSGAGESVRIAAARINTLECCSHPVLDKSLTLDSATANKLTACNHTMLDIVATSAGLEKASLNENELTLRGTSQSIDTAMCIVGLSDKIHTHCESLCVYCKKTGADLELQCSHMCHKACVRDSNKEQVELTKCGSETCNHLINADERLACGLEYTDEVLSLKLNLFKKPTSSCGTCGRWLTPSTSGPIRCPTCSTLMGEKEKYIDPVMWEGHAACSKCEKYPLERTFRCVLCINMYFCEECVTCPVDGHQTVDLAMSPVPEERQERDTTCSKGHDMVPSENFLSAACAKCKQKFVVEGWQCVDCCTVYCFSCKFQPAYPPAEHTAPSSTDILDVFRATQHATKSPSPCTLNTSVLTIFTNSDSLLAE